MKIAIYISQPSPSFWGQDVYFINKLVQEWSHKDPECRFTIFSPIEEVLIELISECSNIEAQKVPAASGIISSWKLQFRMKRKLRSLKPAVFISFNHIFSLSTSTNQVVIYSTLPSSWRKRALLNVAKLMLPSNASKLEVAKLLPHTADNLQVIRGAADEFVFTDEAHRMQVKDRHTGGAEYLLLNSDFASSDDVVFVLKSFSIFKKRQKTSMKIVMAGKPIDSDKINELLQHYKYKDDVVIVDALNRDERFNLLASAYALIESLRPNQPLLVSLQAMAAFVPVLYPKNSGLNEIAPDHETGFDPLSVQDLADKMIRIYKDENWRKKVADENRNVLQIYSWPKVAATIWEQLNPIGVK